MRHLIVTSLPWLMSAVTIWMTVLAGNRHRHAWAIGLANQALWLGWIIAAEAWGLIPMNLTLWAVYVRNHLKWRSPPPAVTKTQLSDAAWQAMPLGMPDLGDDEVAMCDQIDRLFARHRQARPTWQLRDQLVTIALWSRWGWRVGKGLE